MGHPDSFDFPVVYKTVYGATPDAIVVKDPRLWVDAFIDAGRDLVEGGCTGLATTCGFLTLVRDDVAAACGVPVAASSLECVAQVGTGLPDGQVPGILTISQASLSPAHLEAGGVPKGVPIQGVDGGHFAKAILGNKKTLDTDAARREMVEGAMTLCEAHPNVGALVLECTNMPPYSAEIAAATGRPVYSILTHLTAFHATLPPRAS